MVAGPAAGAPVVRARVPVAGTRRARGLEAVVGGLVAGVGALRPAGTGIARVRAGAAAAGVGAVAEEPVVARGGVVRMRAGAGAVALVVRARVPVAGTRRAGGLEAVVDGLVAGVGALRPAGAGIARVHAGAAAARVGAVAEEPVVARGGVVRMRAGAGAVALVVRARVPVVGTPWCRGAEAVADGLVAGA